MVSALLIITVAVLHQQRCKASHGVMSMTLMVAMALGVALWQISLVHLSVSHLLVEIETASFDNHLR